MRLERLLGRQLSLRLGLHWRAAPVASVQPRRGARLRQAVLRHGARRVRRVAVQGPRRRLLGRPGGGGVRQNGVVVELARRGVRPKQRGRGGDEAENGRRAGAGEGGGCVCGVLCDER